MAATTEQLLRQLQACAATLDTDEQAILAHLQSNDNRVSGSSCAPDSTLEQCASGAEVKATGTDACRTAPALVPIWLLVVVRHLAAGQNQQATDRRNHGCEQDADLGIVFYRATFDRTARGLRMAVIFGMTVTIAM